MTDGRISISSEAGHHVQLNQGNAAMCLQEALQEYLNTSGESMQALSLRAGLNPKAVSDIVNLPGIRPKQATIATLSAAVGADLPAAAATAPVTYGELINALEGNAATEADRKKVQRRVRRLKWLIEKNNWAAQTKLVCRKEVLKFFQSSKPATFGLTAGSFSTYKSEIMAALETVHVRARGRNISDVDGLYSDVHEAIRNSDLPKDMKAVAGSFLVYLHDRGMSPGDISTTTLRAYFEHRRENSVKDKSVCVKHVKRVADLLRELAAGPEFAIFGFKAAPHPFGDGRRKFGVSDAEIAAVLEEFDHRIAPWAQGEISRDGETRSEFIAMLDQKELGVSSKKALLRKKRSAKGKTATQPQDKRSRDKELQRHGFLTRKEQWSERTLKNRRGYVAAAAKALYADSKILIETIADLTDPEYAEAVAEALQEANEEGGFDSDYPANVLKMIRKLARDFLCRDADDIEEIAELISAYSCDRQGIAARNKAKLRQFTPHRIQKTIDLSDIIVGKVNAEVDRRRQSYKRAHGKMPQLDAVYDPELAREVMTALAHDIMLKRAPRSDNLKGIRLEWIRWQEGQATIVIPAARVKMREAQDPDLAIPLSDASSRLLSSYIDKIRPLVLREGDTRNPFLFPGQGGRDFEPGRCYTSILNRLARRVHEVVGVKIHPHLYRHLIGWIWLREDPNNLPRVQRLLGHKSLQTTLNHYAEIDDEVALDGWQEYLNAQQKK